MWGYNNSLVPQILRHRMRDYKWGKPAFSQMTIERRCFTISACSIRLQDIDFTMNKGLIATLFLLPLCAFGTLQADDLDAIATDCRAEGEAAGMQGSPLEDFVKECVEELSGLSYDNQVGPEDKT